MNDFENQDSKLGFAMKLWRGERMCLLGFDVTDPEPDFVGFAIECQNPGANAFEPLLNRLAFAYDTPATHAVTGARQFPSTAAPFQKFRWVHFPHAPQAGTYTYRATKMHMDQHGTLTKGTTLTLPISLDPVTYHDFLDVGFTRNFASSQAFRDKFPPSADMSVIGKQIIPARADDGLAFQKMPGDIYDWLGFEARDLVFGMLDEALHDPTITLDVFAYDCNEPDIVARLEQLGPRLRAIIDDSTNQNGNGHGAADSAESQAVQRLRASAGAEHIHRTHFSNLQHHKVFIASRHGQPFKVLAGSTNFSFRGLYIQANNVLLFHEPSIAGVFGKVFEAAFTKPSAFKSGELAAKWHLVQAEGRPAVHVCFAPHTSSDLSLNPVRGAIDQAHSSVLYAVAFLNQLKSGPTKEAFDRLIRRPVFSYGISDKAGTLEVRKPDGSIGLVDFAYLAEHAPEPFRTEWSGGMGINVHHKFVVTDFNLPTAKVFTGSSNLAPSGERGNGDHLIMIEDSKIAIGYAIEALRIFDHLHFRTLMQAAAHAPASPASATDQLTLRKPTLLSGKAPWFANYYVPGSHKERDRTLFSR